jgi:TonB family protein
MYKTLVLPLISTLLLHATIVLMLLVDWDGTDTRVRKVQPSYVKATLVTLDKPKAKPVKKNTSAAKKVAASKKARADDAAKKRTAAKKREVKKLREAEKQRDVARQRDKAKQAEQQRRQQEQREQLARQAERELAEAIAAESEQQQAANDTELASSYIGLMTETIQKNWNRPPSARNNMEAELMIQLVPTGQVVSVDIIKSSGNEAFDRSAVKAVEKADRFPELQNLPNRVFEKNFRRLRIKFRPEDLRL